MKKSFFQSKNTAPLGGSDEAQNEVSFDATSAAEDASCAPNQEPIIVAPQGRQDAAPGLLPNERSESINTLQAPGTAPGSPKEIVLMPGDRLTINATEFCTVKIILWNP
jgi:hypothetical protein